MNYNLIKVPDEEMTANTCEMMRQCWYKDLRKPILDLPPGHLTSKLPVFYIFIKYGSISSISIS